MKYKTQLICRCSNVVLAEFFDQKPNEKARLDKLRLLAGRLHKLPALYNFDNDKSAYTIVCPSHKHKGMVGSKTRLVNV